jgi:predicted O-methyltransferase YrrM
VPSLAPVRDEALYPNWFAMYADRYFAQHLAEYAGRPGLRFLQIGAYTGDATTWLFEHVLTAPDAVLTDVDTWRGSDEDLHDPMDFAEVERIYDARTAPMRAAGRLVKFKGTSKAFFDSHPDARFDFVYIDGDHTAFGVLNDAVRAYPLLRVGGLIGFDDYLWESGRGRLAEPAPAIDAIADLYSGRLERLDDVVDGREVWFRKAGAPEDREYERPAAGRQPRRRFWARTPTSTS